MPQRNIRQLPLHRIACFHTVRLLFQLSRLIKVRNVVKLVRKEASWLCQSIKRWGIHISPCSTLTFDVSDVLMKTSQRGKRSQRFLSSFLTLKSPLPLNWREMSTKFNATSSQASLEYLLIMTVPRLERHVKPWMESPASRRNWISRLIWHRKVDRKWF